MAIAWTLRDPRVTSALVGASSVRQLEESLAAVNNLYFTDEELARIEPLAVDGSVDLWRSSVAPPPDA
jgi:L-glyceraldehyde 3-phosphate reductase